MLTPLNLELIQKELGTRNGWIELGAILLAFASRLVGRSPRTPWQRARIARGPVRRRKRQPPDFPADHAHPAASVPGDRAPLARAGIFPDRDPAGHRACSDPALHLHAAQSFRRALLRPPSAPSASRSGAHCCSTTSAYCPRSARRWTRRRLPIGKTRVQPARPRTRRHPDGHRRADSVAVDLELDRAASDADIAFRQQPSRRAGEVVAGDLDSGRLCWSRFPLSAST